MKIKFIQPAQLELVVGLDEDGETPILETDVFEIGDTEEVELIETNESFKTATIQFGDGSVCYGLPQSVFEVTD